MMNRGLTVGELLVVLLVACMAWAVRAFLRRRRAWPAPPELRPAPPRPPPVLPTEAEIDRRILGVLDDRSPMVDCDISDAIHEALARPIPRLGFHVKCVVPRLDALEGSGAVLVVGFPGRLYFGKRHEEMARAAGWSPAAVAPECPETGGAHSASYTELGEACEHCTATPPSREAVLP